MFAIRQKFITIMSATNVTDIFVVIYDNKQCPSVVSIANNPKVCHCTTADTMRAALYRTTNDGHYELLSYKQMTPGDLWQIDFCDVIQPPLATCTNIYHTPYVIGA